MFYNHVWFHVIRGIFFFPWNGAFFTLSHTFPFLCRLSPAKPLCETLDFHGGHLASLTVTGITAEGRVCPLSCWSFFGPTVESLCPSTSGMGGLPFEICLYPFVWFGPSWDLPKPPNSELKTKTMLSKFDHSGIAWHLKVFSKSSSFCKNDLINVVLTYNIA